MFRPAPDGVVPWINMTNAARLIGLTTKTLRLAAEAVDIQGVHPLPDGSCIFARSKLGHPVTFPHDQCRAELESPGLSWALSGSVEPARGSSAAAACVVRTSIGVR